MRTSAILCKFMPFTDNILHDVSVRYANELLTCFSVPKSYVTGQTWLGVAVTISYTFFGLSGNNTGAVQGINDGRGIASDRDEATRSSVATNHHEHSI